MAVKRTLTKQKKKKWFTIFSPKEFRSNIVGETLASDPNLLKNRKVKVNLANLIGDPKKQSIEITLKIKEIKGTEAHTEIIKYTILPPNIKRIVRTGKSKLDDSFIIETKDKSKLRIKPLLITRKKVKNSIATEIRKKAREYLKKHISTTPLDALFPLIISGRLQRELREYISKIYPLTNCQIRILEKL